MKDVSELLAKRLKRLGVPFSCDWIVDFSSFIEFIRTNPPTIQILDSINEQKEAAHAPLIQNLKELFREGAKCLKGIQKMIGRKYKASYSIDELLKN
ncbi:hypothetical protein [Candidatus Protochlamydia amoebophila]|uniref:Uncharacterized protein n=1 Tax=Protochlamydia amoebophila (strain UWE25) TaxID=264201 RepID=Q6MCY1_PARUW|nr:hypothetical protein [Candidatus Protochlamydia amoebophila]CAF23568.1 unnamed protein product [Candidatus Protochlamydia amoebophila UWE25]